MAKSSDDYVLDPGHCPGCGSSKIFLENAIAVTENNHKAESGVSCDACGSSWIDVYKLVGYRELLDSRVEYTVTLLYPGGSNETYVSTASALSVGEAVQLVQEEAATINGGFTYSVEDFPVLTCMHVEDGKIVVDL